MRLAAGFRRSLINICGFCPFSDCASSCHSFTCAYYHKSGRRCRIQEFTDIKCSVIGCSVDNVFSHLAWIGQPRKEVRPGMSAPPRPVGVSLGSRALRHLLMRGGSRSARKFPYLRNRSTFNTAGVLLPSRAAVLRTPVYLHLFMAGE